LGSDAVGDEGAGRRRAPFGGDPRGVRGGAPFRGAGRQGSIVKFVMLESTAALKAEAAMPISPVASTPTGRAPLKVRTPTCASSGLFGSAGVACRKTLPVTATLAPLTTTSSVRRYQTFS